MEVKYFRKGSTITDKNGNVVFQGTYKHGENTFSSNNAAKRESRKIQDREGPCLRVVK